VRPRLQLLEGLDLGPKLKGGGEGLVGCLDFIDGQYPGSDQRWVEAEDRLSLSLLQARLIELGVPIKVTPARWS
jgi:hypothetical protein